MQAQDESGIEIMNFSIAEKYKKHQQWLLFFLILLGALFLRTWYRISHTELGRDEIYYINLALNRTRDTAQEKILQPPLLILFLQEVFHYGNNSITTAKIVANFVGLLFVIPWWFIGKRVFRSISAATLLMGLAAVLPVAVEYSCVILRETLYLPVIAWLLLFLTLYYQRASAQYLVGIGIFLGIGIIIRYETLEWLIFVLGLIVWQERSSFHKAYRILLRVFLVMMPLSITLYAMCALMDYSIEEVVLKVLSNLHARLNA